MKKIKSMVSLLLSIALLIGLINSIFINPVSAQPIDEVSLRQYTYGFDEWIIDEDNNYMYVLDTGNSSIIYFIELENLNLEETMRIENKAIVDMDLHSDKLYVADRSNKYILVYDINTKELEYTIDLNLAPRSIEVGDDEIFFATDRKVYEYDLTTKETTFIGEYSSGYGYDYNLELLLEDNHLYIGQGLPGGLYKYDIVKKEFIDFTDNYGNGESKMIIHDDDIYFAGRRIDKNDFSINPNSYIILFEWLDTFEYLGDELIHVNDKYVFSKESVYNKNTEEEIGTFDSIEYITNDSKGNYYVYSLNDLSIRRYKELGDIDYYHSNYEEEIPGPSNVGIKLNPLDDIEITWDEVSGAEGYNIYRTSSLDSKSYTKLNDEVVKDNNFVIETSNIYGYLGYYYGVTSIKEGKESVKEYVGSDHLQAQDKLIKEMVVGEGEDERTLVKIDPFHFGMEFINTSEDRVYLPITNNTKNTNVTMESNHLIDILDRGISEQLSKKIHIETENGAMAYAVGSFSMNNIGDKIFMLANGKLEFNINVLDDNDIKDSLLKNNINLLSNVIEYNVGATKNGERVDLYRFDHSYIEHWIPLEKTDSYADVTGIKYDKESSTYRFMPTTFIEDENGKHWAVIKGNGTGTFAVVKGKNTFTDTGDTWAKEEIDALANKLLLLGFDGKYNPSKNVTRAEFITLLIRGLGLDIEKTNSEKFTDVKLTDWYFDTINTAHNKGLVTGYVDNTFKPNQEISREEIISMTIRALEFIEGEKQADRSVLTKYQDNNDIGNWAKDAAAKSVELGIITGRTDTTFVPKAKTKRSESAVILKRLVERAKFIQY